MHCPGCGRNIDGVEELCRREFEEKQGRYFSNLRVARRRQYYWRGVLLAVVPILSVICFLYAMGGVSWNGFVGIIHRVSERGYFPFFALFLMPFLCGMVCGLFGSLRVDAAEVRSYEKFREAWGLPKNSEATKGVL